MKRLHMRAVIDALGGPRAVAETAGVSVVAVYAWLRVNSLPLDRAMQFAEKLGIDRDLLHDPWRGRGQDIMDEKASARMMAKRVKNVVDRD